MSPPPCKTGQPCPEIERAKFEVTSEFSEALRTAIDPLLAKFNKTAMEMAVYAERMNFGAARFERVEEDVKDLRHKSDKFKTFMDTHEGQQQAATRAGWWAGILSGIAFGALNLFVLYISR